MNAIPRIDGFAYANGMISFNKIPEADIVYQYAIEQVSTGLNAVCLRRVPNGMHERRLVIWLFDEANWNRRQTSITPGEYKLKVFTDAKVRGERYPLQGMTEYIFSVTDDEAAAGIRKMNFTETEVANQLEIRKDRLHANVITESRTHQVDI